MRSIRKFRPPQNIARVGEAPCSMLDAERDFLSTLATSLNKVRHARARFDALEKSRIREILFVEQRFICVYCERRIEESPNTPRIDHWLALSEDPTKALHWPNLHLSCANDGTCDKAKGNRRLAWNATDPLLPLPSVAAYENFVGFTSGGEMYVRSNTPLDEPSRNALELMIADRTEHARTRKAVLNLNHPALIEARKAALDSERTQLNKIFRNRRAPDREREATAIAMLQEPVFQSFISIRVAWLIRSLGKNKPDET